MLLVPVLCWSRNPLTQSTNPNMGGGTSGCLGGKVTPAGGLGEPGAPMFWVEATTDTTATRDTLDRTILRLDVERLEATRELEEVWRRADIS